MPSVLYKKGYKYQLFSDRMEPTKIYPFKNIVTQHIELDTDGNLTIKKGYAWDGPSGPVIDSKCKMRGSLAHDALYQLSRGGHLTDGDMVKADELFRLICIEDGLAKWRARLYYIALRKFGGAARREKNKRVIHSAPK